jgi:predicted RND superfamily exporter protein
MNSTHIILLSKDVDRKTVSRLANDLMDVDGVKKVLGLDTLVGSSVPMELIPDDVRDVVESDNYQLLMVMSEYKVASDEVNHQCEVIDKLIKEVDSGAMLVGEAPCTKDLIDTTAVDFRNVNIISIAVIAVIIALVFRSASIPVLLVSAIEFAIFINLGIPHYTGTVLPFVASIVIGTIQLGSTVDYAILLTNNYKEKRLSGFDRKESVRIALQKSITSIIVSGFTFFSATFGVGLYSKIDMISSLCTLMARGAIISMFTVILVVPAFLILFDRLIV